MKQLKAMPEAKFPPAPRFRYWTTPPEFLTLRVSDIEEHVPKANWIPGGDPERLFEIPAASVLSKNVPRISLRQLAEVIPDCVLPSDGVIKLPSKRLATAYRLVLHSEELPPEVVEEEPEAIAPPQMAEEVLSEAGDQPAAAGSDSADPEGGVLPTSSLPQVEAFPEAALETAPEDPSEAEPQSLEPPPPTVTGKMPPRREGRFIGLPIFRRKSAAPESPRPNPPFSGIRLPRVQGAPIPHPSAVNEVPEPEEIPSEPVGEIAGDPPVPMIDPEPAEPAGEIASATSAPMIDPEPAESLGEPAEEIASGLADHDIPPACEPVQVLHTETMSDRSHDQEITEQGPMQALFLTDEEMTVGRVIELCGGLPGINSCVLAHGSLVVAAHNVPEGVDLISMSAHAAEMLQSMRESSARMGVGTVPAVTLHTEKGVISFFHRDDLTMLVFHKDRGFIPGVREKMAAVLGELTKARLTLPVGGNG